MAGYPKDSELFNDIIDGNIKMNEFKNLGKGGFGDVLLYRSKNTTAAIKRVKLGARSKNLMEYNIHNQLHKVGNKHVIGLYDVLKTKDFLYFFMEFAASGDLEQKLVAKGSLSLTVAKEYFTQLIDGVDFIHTQGIVHRDLKPGNLFFSTDGTLKIGDFGAATKFRDAKGRNIKVSLFGTKSHWAPEVEAAKKFVDGPPMDIWSCGIILIEMIAGCRPWEVATLPNLKNWISNDLDKTALPWNAIDADVMAFLRNILDVDPETRATIEEIREDKWFSGKDGIENNNGEAEQPKKERKRKIQNEIKTSEENVRKRQRVPKKKFGCLDY
ncbi:hypothetical protein CRE_20858 [Caenorhabditis remanei]|uniref:Protein kinase domain-containing protein n=1 Tax=Caenorhabditis remanei TaxID=31234 RepID=E3MV63_CAERE|nr:hypothetical protein CRE_20858 [Caenorhabditis remanei]